MFFMSNWCKVNKVNSQRGGYVHKPSCYITEITETISMLFDIVQCAQKLSEQLNFDSFWPTTISISHETQVGLQ
jgi:hypothetical protein